MCIQIKNNINTPQQMEQKQESQTSTTKFIIRILIADFANYNILL